MTVKILITFHSNQRMNEFLNDLNKFNKIKTQKEKKQNKKQMCIIQLLNYIMNC